MLGATETNSGPEVAPVGIVTVIEVLLHELIVTNAPFSVAKLVLCDAPNPDPLITTWLPIGPVVAESPVVTGAAAASVFSETLSNVAVVRVVSLLLLTASPM